MERILKFPEMKLILILNQIYKCIILLFIVSFL